MWGGQYSCLPLSVASRATQGPESHCHGHGERDMGAGGLHGPWGVCASPPQEHPVPSAGIVISSSSASPSEGTSSDSCLTFSAGDSPAGLSGCLAAQGLVGTCSPLKLASPLLGAQSATPVLQAQGALGGAALLPISFQEGRRASDTSLTQGDFPFTLIPTFPPDAVCPGRFPFVLDGRGSPIP